jgi:hypothetical protein
MARVFEKWLGILTVAGTIVAASLRLANGGKISTEVMVGCIWAILAGITTTEFLKRQLTLDKIQKQLDELSPSVRQLATRVEMYGEAVQMITNARIRIQDTSWGLDPDDPEEIDTVSRTEYREARCPALRHGVNYRELYTLPNAKRVEYLAGALRLGAGFRTHHFVRVLRSGDQPPQVEFLIVDGRELLLSLPHVLHRHGHTPFVRLTSPQLSALFEGLFDDCWDCARPVKLTETNVVYAESGQEVVLADSKAAGGGRRTQNEL